MIRIYLAHNLKYNVMNNIATKKLWDFLESKYFTKSIENRFHLMWRLYRFQLKRGVSIRDHMNNFTELLADLANVDEKIKDIDKMLILLNYLPNDKYETFVLTLINEKSSLCYNEVTTTQVNYDLRTRNPHISHRGRLCPEVGGV